MVFHQKKAEIFGKEIPFEILIKLWAGNLLKARVVDLRSSVCPNFEWFFHENWSWYRFLCFEIKKSIPLDSLQRFLNLFDELLGCGRPAKHSPPGHYLLLRSCDTSPISLQFIFHSLNSLNHGYLFYPKAFAVKGKYKLPACELF